MENNIVMSLSQEQFYCILHFKVLNDENLTI